MPSGYGTPAAPPGSERALGRDHHACLDRGARYPDQRPGEARPRATGRGGAAFRLAPPDPRFRLFHPAADVVALRRVAASRGHPPRERVRGRRAGLPERRPAVVTGGAPRHGPYPTRDAVTY